MKILVIVYLFMNIHVLSAAEVKITKDIPYVNIKDKHHHTIRIQRTNKVNSYLTNTFALTSRPSPPFFIQPFLVNDKVETYGELEVLDFIAKQKGLFVDARLKNWYKESAIPTAMNIPFKIFLTDSKERNDVLRRLGGVLKADKWQFNHVKKILFYCNGAWCGQSPTAIHALITLGYPQEQIKYYRGGMQAWQLLGLTTIVPKEKK